MTKNLKKDLAGGTFAMSLPQCELRQSGTATPRVYSGTGFVDQQPDGNLTLRMFATEEVEEIERIKRMWPENLTPGVLIPDTSYYDLKAVDQKGNEWRAVRQQINEIFGVGSEIHVSLRRFEKVEALPRSVPSPSKTWLIPSKTIQLPWHALTKTATQVSTDRFEFEDHSFAWEVHKEAGGLNVKFLAKETQLEPHATRFLQAFAMLVGEVVEPLVSYTHDGEVLITRIYPRNKIAPPRLLGPMQMRILEHHNAHQFLVCCLNNAVQTNPDPHDQLLILYRFWHRILRAHQGDVENSSLVLSVAIEGALKALCHSEHDADSTFAALLDENRSTIEALPINDRVREVMLRSLENANFPKPKDTMIRLVEQGLLTNLHVKAWSKMRNTGAHGTLLQDDDAKFQEHLNRYFCCLDLFYRLMLLAIGYRGNFVDRSSVGWPSVEFLANHTIPVKPVHSDDEDNNGGTI